MKYCLIYQKVFVDPKVFIFVKNLKVYLFSMDSRDQKETLGTFLTLENAKHCGFLHFNIKFTKFILSKGLAIFLILKHTPPSKVTKSIFYNMSSFLLMLLAQKFFFDKTKVYLLWETKKCFDGKPKLTQKFEFEKLKIPNPDIWQFWEIFNFSNSIFFGHFWFPIEKIFFSQSKNIFVVPK